MFAENFTQTLRILTIACLSLLLASCGSGSGGDSVDASDADAEAARYQLAFADYFGDPPDADSRAAAKVIPKAALTAGNWVVDTGYGENGWGNDEWQRYDNSMDNLFTQNGNLVIRARCATAPACGKRNGEITSAKITSKNRINVRYGIIKARIKMPAGIGMWPAFWTLGSDIDERPWPNAGELDIVEMHYYYSDTHTTHFSTHWAGPRYTAANRPVCSSGVGAIDPAEEENCKTESKTFDDPLTDGFHVYEIEWSENNIVGKIDGITYFNQAIDPATMEEFLKDHYLILNVAVGGTLGGPDGPSMSAADWAKSGNTDMLVDWVEVFERVPPSKGTLIDEAGGNLSYNRIINSAEIGGAFVEADLENRGVTPLVGNSSLRIKYSTSIAESGNGAPASFSGAIFDFNSIDLSDYTKLVFSLNDSKFDNFDSIEVEFQDSRYAPPTVTKGAVSVRTNGAGATLIDRNGDWKTYEIPLKHYAGVNMGDVVALGFFNPKDSNDALIGGKLYVDDIRFVRSKKCNAVPTVAFDSLNYNPLTNVAEVTVKDACAASSLALVSVDNGTDEIMVGVTLDAAGHGQGLFNLVGGASVCETSDSASIIQLSGTLMAEYKRAKTAKGGSAKAFAMAGIDGSAPSTTIAGAKTYILASDPGQSLGFIPDTDFFFSDFGSGSTFDGDFTTDTSFSPVFSVSDLAAQQAILAMFGFTDGFTADAESINFKVKNLPGDTIEVKFGQDGGPETAFTVNLNTYTGSSALGDGWYEVSIPMSEFPDANVYDYVVFASNSSSAANFTYLITDIFLQESAGSVPAECAGEVQPPVSGSGTGASGATGGPFSVSFDDVAVTYDFIGFGNPDTITTLGTDPVDNTNLVAVTTKLSGAQVWAGVTVDPTPSITYPLTVAQSKISIRIYSPGPGLIVRMKMEESGNASNSVETETTTTVDTGWETLTFDFNNHVSGTSALNEAFNYDKLSLFFGFGTEGDGTAYTWDTIEFLGGGGGGPTQVDLPVSFDDANVDYSVTDFGGNTTTLVTDPTDGGNTVAQSVKAGDAQLWAGTTIGADPNGFATAIPFTASETSMTVRVYSPDAGIPVRLKVEDAADNTITVETEALTTGVNTWETLTFDFSNEAAGTAALNLANTYDKASIFFNFGTDGATAGEKTYLWDDVEFVSGGGGPTQVDLPVSFDEANVDYSVTDFGGNATTLVTDPTDGGNTVAQSVKAGDAQLWAGTTIGADPNGFATAIPFTLDNTSMTVRVYSPDAGIPVRLKVEDTADNTITVETEALTTGVNTWETLTFDFSNEAAGTAALNLANTYDKASIFFNFGTDGATAGEKTYLWDDVEFVSGGGGPTQVDLPVSFDDANVDYSVTDFGGNTTTLVTDPTDGGNTVAQSIKAGDAQLWAGTTIGADPNGFATAIPFTASETSMTVRVYSPDAGIPVRLKVEDAADNTITVETEALTTGVNTWETLTFDFSNEAAGTAALNLANTYDKASIFFNFGTDGATAGEKTYLWDDVEFVTGSGGGGNVGGGPTGDFEDSSIAYVLTDFGGNATSLVADPTDASNTVAQSIKAGDAQLWAGTTFGDDMSDNGSLPFTMSDTQITVRVYSPEANIPVRLKVENLLDPTISVETEAMTTVADAWETLVFDFANEVGGTAALDLSSTYNKLSIFFNFGTDGATAGEQTYLWDDVVFTGGGGIGGGGPSQVDLPVTFDEADVDYSLTDFGDTFSELVADPEDGANTVVRTMKPVISPLWAGTTIGADPNGFATAIPFTASETSMTVRVYSPDAGIPVRLKVEDAADNTITVETEALTTGVNTWETLTFDFSNEAAGTAALNLANTYDKASIFFNFGTDGATAGEKTYLWDDVEFVSGGGGGPTQVDLPVSFDDANVDYSVTDFGGNTTTLVTDPTDGGNTVAQSIKAGDAQLWAGTTIGADPNGFATAIPFTLDNTSMTVRVYSPDAGIPVRLKVEDTADNTITVETEALTTGVNTWETLTFDFSNEAAGTAALNLANTYDKASIFFNFGTDGATAGEKTYLWDDVEFVSGGGGGPTQVDLPVSFDDANVDYSLTDFGDTVSVLVVDPEDGANTVVSTVKPVISPLWAGTTIGADPNGFATAIPFTASETSMTVRVYSPDAGIPVRLKVEDAADNTITVETEALTTGVNTWETLTFDFSNEAAGTAALNLANTYDKASIFFNFGTDGATAGEKTYLWDDVEFVTGSGGGGNVGGGPTGDFEDSSIAYVLTDFGGNATSLVADPTDASNTVAQSIKAGDAQLWAGTTFGDDMSDNGSLPFTMSDTQITVRVYSPEANIPVRLKVENLLDPTISVETEAMTTVADAWETLVFDFANEVGGTAALDLSSTYNKLSIFFNFGTDGATAGEQTYLWDDVVFTGGGGIGGGGPSQVDLPVTFDEADVDYSLTDFGDTFSELVADPEDGANTVVRTMKPVISPLWAGTTIGADPNGFATAIPFTASETSMTVRVYSPDAGIPVRLKVEDAADNTITVETEALTTGVNTWETLTFDFSNEAAGTAALNLANTYDKASIFFNFGTDGATAGDKTYYWDDVEFVTGGGGPTQVDLPVSFDEANVDYSVTDFGGNATTLVTDPTDGGNTVAQSVKAGDAQLWAGTTIGADPNGFATAIPFTLDNTSMTVRVYSPDAGIPVRLKVEDTADNTITVETEALTTGVNTWETLTFDFSNEAAGTAALNLANTYDKASIFFNFGTDGATAGEKTYLWDDVEFVSGAGGGATFVNGDFETGDFTGWVQTPDAGTSVTPGTITITAPPGGQAGTAVVRLQAAGEAAGSQDVLLSQVALGAGSIVQGQTINVSFDLYGSLSGAGGVVFVELIYLNSDGDDVGRNFVGAAAPYVPTTTWTKYPGSKAAGFTAIGTMVSVDGGVTLELKASCGPVPGCAVDAYIDNVTYTVTP